jgi:hypothetical protein
MVNKRHRSHGQPPGASRRRGVESDEHLVPVLTDIIRTWLGYSETAVPTNGCNGQHIPAPAERASAVRTPASPAGRRRSDARGGRRRQWFRLAARHPRAQLSMPSALVDDLWRELVRDTRGYATFCDAAFGRFLPHEPEPAMGAADATADGTTRLRHTLGLAGQDAECRGSFGTLLDSPDRSQPSDGCMSRRTTAGRGD